MKKAIFILTLISLLTIFSACNKSSIDDSSITSIADVSWQETQDKIKITPAVKEMDDKMKIRQLDSVSFKTDDTTNEVALTLLKNELNKNGISITDDAQTSIYLGSAKPDLPDGEGYVLDTTTHQITLAAKSAFGQYYAVQTFAKLLDGNTLSAAVITDSPDFPIRGVVEGFYGVPWSHEDRMSIIRFLGENRMNTYLYAPKDDDKIRLLWREPYTNDELNNLHELNETAKNNSVRFVFSLSPGNDFDFGAGYENDFATLVEKYNALYDLGVRDFALLLDDLPVRNAQSAANHVRLVNDFRQRFYSDKDDLSELICIFAEYLDSIVTEEYTNTITESLNSDVLVMWTGPTIEVNLNASGFNFANKAYNRKMLVWWNYPVNDYCEGNLLADAAKGLSLNLKTAVSGLLSNPMNQAETSKAVLMTLSEYLWNAKAYRPVTSYPAAIKKLFPEVSESVHYFFEKTFAAGVNNNTDSVIFKKLISDFNAELDKNIKNGDAADKLRSEFEKLKSVIVDIKDNCKNKNFVDEITPWLNKADLTADMALIYLDVLNAKDEAEYWEYCRLFFDLKQKFESNPVNFSERTLAPFVMVSALDGLRTLRPESLELKQNVVLTKFTDIEGQPTVSSPLHWYDKYNISNILDDKDDTFYWSNAAADKGYWIMLDLGKPQHVFNIRLKGGVSPSGSDFIQKGQMQYSNDGIEWFDIGEVQTKRNVTILELDINCRYIRYVALEDQVYWVSVSEFAVNIRTTSDLVSADPEGAYEFEQHKIIDGDYFSYYKAHRKPRSGERIVVSTPDIKCQKIDILQSSISGGEVYAYIDGKEVLLGTLDKYHNSFTLEKATSIDKLVLVWKSDTIPQINEILFR